MAKAEYRFLVCICIIGTLSTPRVLAQAPDRGQLLYENHCGGCHDSKVHIRNNRTVRSQEGLRHQVNRWSRELKLRWGRGDIADVSDYLYGRFYLTSRDAGVTPMNLTLTSPAFRANGNMPVRLTCDGADSSPALFWSGMPKATKSLVLIVDDPDAPDPAAPKMTWVHWVLYNIPADIGGLPEAVAADELPTGILQGLNDWKRIGYGGPCPPIGRHRYFHKLYALDIVLPDLKAPAKSSLEKAMQDHILQKAELIGTYQRQ